MTAQPDGPPLLVTAVIRPQASAPGPASAPPPSPVAPPDAPAPAASSESRGEALFDRFEIGPRVLVSASGHTFLVTDRDDPAKPQLAAKLFTARYSAHVRVGRETLATIAATAQPASGALPRLHRIEAPEDCLMLVADAPRGLPLDQVLLNAPTGLAPNAAIAMIAQLAQGLGTLHSLGFVHGDVRPSSVFVDVEAERAMLADWGHAIPVHLSMTDARSMPGNTLDGVQYASFEVLAGSMPRREDDVFALGCVAYEMLSGTHPFERRTASEVESLGLRPQPLAALNASQNALLLATLAPRRHERSISLTELAAAFGARSVKRSAKAVAKDSKPAGPALVTRWMSAAKGARDRAPAFALGVAGCAVVTLVAAFVAMSVMRTPVRVASTPHPVVPPAAAASNDVPVAPTGLETVRHTQTEVRAAQTPPVSEPAPAPTPAASAPAPAVVPSTPPVTHAPRAAPTSAERASAPRPSRTVASARATHRNDRSRRARSSIHLASSCSTCDCRVLLDKRTFTFEPLREDERSFLARNCRG